MGPFFCEIVRSLLQTLRVHIYTLVLTRLLVDHDYNIYCLKLIPRCQCPSRTRHQFVSFIFNPRHHAFPNAFSFNRGTVLLPDDDILLTADAFTKCFEENLLPNGAFLPNSAHRLVSSLYQFLVLTVGTPHEESIATILSTKTCQIKRNRRNHTKNSSNP
jgi:hypothetical protein